MKQKNTATRIVLSFPGDGPNKELDGYQISAIPRRGDILQWNGVQFPIKEVVFHQKEGFEPYIELKTDYREEDL